MNRAAPSALGVAAGRGSTPDPPAAALPMRPPPPTRPSRDRLAPFPPVTRHPPALLDERSDPDFRSVFTSLLGRASGAWCALTRVRLAGLDLREEEVPEGTTLRVLLAQVSAHALGLEADAALADPERAPPVRLVARLVRSRRLEVRSAPLAGWSPDFTVFHRAGGPWALLAGHHWFRRPYPHRGPALASVHGSGAALRAAARFAEAWERAHDISLPILGVLEESQRRAGEREPPRDPAGPGPGRSGAKVQPGADRADPRRARGAGIL